MSNLLSHFQCCIGLREKSAMKKIFGLFNSSPMGSDDGLEAVDSLIDKTQPSAVDPFLPVSTITAEDMELAEAQAKAVTDLGERHELIAARLSQIGEILQQLNDAQTLAERLTKPLADTFRHHQATASQIISLNHALERTGSELVTVRERDSTAMARMSALELKLRHLQEAHTQLQTLQRSTEEELRLTAGELRQRDTVIGDLERRIHDLLIELDETRDDLVAATARVHEGEAAHGVLVQQLREEREDYQGLEKEHESLQTSIQHTVSEVALSNRRLNEAEEEASSARARLLQVESALTETQSEKVRLMEKINEMELSISEERRNLSVKAEGMRSRSMTLEKLLTQAREEVANQADALRDAMRRSAEMSITVNRLETRIEKANSDLKKGEEDGRIIEQSRAALAERGEMMEKAIRAKDAALGRAKDVAETLAQRLTVLEGRTHTQSEGYERQIADMTAALERERTERALLEGTLEAARQDKQRLQRELIQYRSRLVEEALVEVAPKSKEGADGQVTPLYSK